MAKDKIESAIKSGVKVAQLLQQLNLVFTSVNINIIDNPKA